MGSMPLMSLLISEGIIKYIRTLANFGSIMFSKYYPLAFLRETNKEDDMNTELTDFISNPFSIHMLLNKQGQHNNRRGCPKKL